MSTHKPFRFGVIVYATRSRDEWITCARKAEDSGYSVFLMPDHFEDQFAPIPALATVADVTRTLHIGSFVFDNDFRHPVVLAKEAATFDVLSNGRFEFGLGAGWMRSEYDQAGISFDAPEVRVSRLEEAVPIIKGLFAGEPLNFTGQHYTITNLTGSPKPVQQPHPPILIGGGGKRLLSLAAREANIVSIVPRVLADGSRLDIVNMLPEATEQKIAWIRQAAGERFKDLELNAIVFNAIVTPDRQQAVGQLADRFGSRVTAEQVLEIPHLLVGNVDQICEDLWARRDSYSISYISIFEESMEAMAPVVARLAGK